ncbi:MAG TPA: hypothetical protein VF789_26750 [Thermoanaerobaculia bacterium]
MSRELVLLGVAGLVTVGATISTLEWLANWRQLKAGGLFSWQVAESRPALAGTLLGKLAGAFLAYPNILGLLALRLIALLALLPAIASGRFVAWILGVVVATTVLLNVRSPYGMDGSDQMATQVFGALFLGFLPGTDFALDAALCYIALQACLSYATAGLVKVISPYWHRGDALFGIFNTRTFGHPAVARFLHGRPGLTRMLSWGVVAAELAFPLSLILGYPYGLVFLGWGVFFHAANALVMGINSFFWSFVATYPAILYCAWLLRT